MVLPGTQLQASIRAVTDLCCVLKKTGDRVEGNRGLRVMWPTLIQAMSATQPARILTPPFHEIVEPLERSSADNR